ncbi:hypothetical protein BASA61_002339 [Batrachochytrium salamandrivorans]|nr:hypothetical protein BASA61_002339 [Batrachochytrium salamandrivorans]KAH9272081.1 hypothetical protein BASA83_005670 [Batrachochytrium salamandrivorans]
MFAVSFVLALALVSSTVVAQPTFEPPETSTKSVYEWMPLDEGTPTPTSDEDPADIGLSYILQQLNLQPDEFEMSTSFADSFGVTHVYGMPLHKGSLIESLHASAHVKKGQVFFYSATINKDQVLATISHPPPKSRTEISSEEAVGAVVDCLKVPFYHNSAPVKKCQQTDDEDIPVWKFQLRDDPMTQLPEAEVDENTDDVVPRKRFKRGFTYRVVSLPNKNPNDGFSTIVNPENFQASPKGWTEGYKTIGNNVEVKSDGVTPFETTTLGMFNRVFDPTSPPQTLKNLVAGIINAFYVTNTFHDITYQYGFTEKAGNFQRNNFDRGGIEDDPAIINVQGSKKRNYAEFNTYLDGHPGVLNLHIFTATEPNRDPALDNTILTHELGHGLSDRLTGGARTKMCMGEIESEGLSEGYSDVITLILTAKPEDTRNTKKVIAEYVKGDSRGSRRYPYTTNMRFNPLKYQDAVGEKNPYRIGEIWAVMLFEVYWNLVEKYGFSANLHDATQEKGNIMFLQLFVGTLMIQPCDPTFASARDAMLAADDAYYGGIHKHLIIKGFAKRGFGSIS